MDGHDYHPKRPPQQINVRAGGRVDMLQIMYEGHTGARHGGTEGGQLHRLRLYNGDRVVRVTGRSGLGPGGGIDQLTFHTKKWVTVMTQRSLTKYLPLVGECWDHLVVTGAGSLTLVTSPPRAATWATSLARRA